MVDDEQGGGAKIRCPRPCACRFRIMRLRGAEPETVVALLGQGCWTVRWQQVHVVSGPTKEIGKTRMQGAADEGRAEAPARQGIRQGQAAHDVAGAHAGRTVDAEKGRW
eukprot:jgi/Tetstr1/460479/TSEL_005738.t1